MVPENRGRLIVLAQKSLFLFSGKPVGCSKIHDKNSCVATAELEELVFGVDV